MRSKALVGTAEDRDTTDQDAMCRVPSAECRESRGRPERLNHHYDVAETRAPLRSGRRGQVGLRPSILFGPATSLYYILQEEHVPVDLPYSNRHVLLLEI